MALYQQILLKRFQQNRKNQNRKLKKYVKKAIMLQNLLIIFHNNQTNF